MRLLVIEENSPLRDSINRLLENEFPVSNGDQDPKLLVLLLEERDLLEEQPVEHDGDESVKEKELKAFLKDLVRERRDQTSKEIIQYHGIQMMGKERDILVDGNSITLIAKQYALLEYLIQTKGVILTRENIYERIWEYDSETAITIVEVFIHQLRKILEPFVTILRLKRSVV